MSDEATPAEETVAETVTPDPAALQAEIDKWKALSRKNEEQAKQNAEKALRLDQIEEANKTELQKAQDALNAAQQRAMDAEARALRSDIARTKGVPVELLTGTDEATLHAQAEALLAFRGNTTPAGPPSSGAPTPTGEAPIPSFTDAQIAAMTPDEYQARKADIYRARDAGRITL